MGKEILSLTTLVDRPTVNIASKKHPNGKLYELRSTADMGPIEQAKLYVLQEEANKLAKLKKHTPAQIRQANRALDELINLIVLDLADPTVLARGKDGKPVPSTTEEPHGSLTEQDRQNLVLTWSAELSAKARAEGNARTSRRTGARSSPASKRSTVATRKRGGARQRRS